ncbi:hypothetical protein F5Y14DRAFT_397856 [Nemania sp. NC0429]|nr:hypothetical protein F5Y14DRAFT_397856 [Nemania sp. NC0429]
MADDQEDGDDQDHQANQAQPEEAGLPYVDEYGEYLFNPEFVIIPEVDPGPVGATVSQQPNNHSSYESSPDYKPPPEIATWRLNLTALSQRYNMYAAAYADEIHIYRVSDCVSHKIGRFPNCVLKPPTSDDALAVIGDIDPAKPHRMNHLIMGDLGNQEVLLVAYDDGDVIGYYNAHIDTAISSVTDNFDTVKPFFHENVGRSAWGLAVHGQSRLIAVGANNYQVHVFALALSDTTQTSPEGDPPQLYERDLYVTIKISVGGTVEQNAVLCANEIDLGPGFLKRRQHGHRFIFDIGWRGNNIPNVAFNSDSDGEASEVLAIDISGKLWVINLKSSLDAPITPLEGLYKIHDARINLNSHHDNVAFMRHDLPRGWGVLVLPESSFLPTSTFQESLGLRPKEATYVHHAGYGYYIGTGMALRHVENNAPVHPWFRTGDSDLFRSMLPITNITMPRWYVPELDCSNDWSPSSDEAVENCSKRVKRAPRTKNGMKAAECCKNVLGNGNSVMRTYEMDIELMAGDLDNVGIFFRNVIRQARHTQSFVPGVPFPPERLSTLIHVPELYLVVAGSQCGRVVLITPTRQLNPHYSVRRGFKVEAILPRDVDEGRRLRPMCLLLGVAIGPIPREERGRVPGDGYLGERRYRLMLHYYDHTILSYEVYRNMLTSDLFVL